MSRTEAVIVGLAWVARAGTSPDGERPCQTRSGAQVCILDRGAGRRIEAKGFIPGDELQVTVGR